MKVAIFGLGYVGCVSLGCLAQRGHDVIGVDVSPIKVEQINAGKATIVEKDIDRIIAEQCQAGRVRGTMDFNVAVAGSDIAIICVGTPSSANGHLNLEYVMKVAGQIGLALRDKQDKYVVAIRSTVMPGTIDRFAEEVEKISGKSRGIGFSVLSNPEFLREGTAVHDYYNPPLTLIGSNDSEAAQKLSLLYQGLPGELIIADIKTAEIIKYINNSYHALKIGFANEMGNICKKLEIDSHKVMEIFSKDCQLNISPYYFKPGFAYGGSCLPKDLKGLQTLAHDLYIQAPILQSIDKTNQLQIEAGLKLILDQKARKIGFLGFSFKEGTDDLRNSPAVEVIEALLGKGYTIKIYDKNVRIAHLTGTNKEYIEKHIPHLANLMCDSVEELIDFSQVIVVTTKESDFTDKLLYSTGKTIIDLIRLDERLLSKKDYHGLCW